MKVIIFNFFSLLACEKQLVSFSLCRIAVYKALYRLFGGFVSDVVAAIEQVCQNAILLLEIYLMLVLMLLLLSTEIFSRLYIHHIAQVYSIWHP